jgi:predicted CopG family antitoxin
MATKTLTITEEAYRRLAKLKRENESFSIVIERLTGKNKTKLRDYFGILSKESGDELEKNIKEKRSKHKKSRKRRLNSIAEELTG